VIVEHVVLDVTPGQEDAYEAALAEGLPIISSADGFISLRMIRGIESPSRFVLVVEWESVEAHEVGFRGSEAYQQWRSLLHHFYVTPANVEHFTVIAEVPAK
jgi:heme-degrading monooxygenase HmoA